MPLILSALSKGLKGESEIPEDILSQLLGGLANAIVDIGDLSVRASACCVLARRNIHIDATNIPDSSAKNELLKVPLEGDNLFSGKVQEVTHKSSEMIKDVRGTSKAYGIVNPVARNDHFLINLMAVKPLIENSNAYTSQAAMDQVGELAF